MLWYNWQLDQKLLDEMEKHGRLFRTSSCSLSALPCRTTATPINRALNNLKVWDIPQDEIDVLHEEANKISADKNAWFKTPEGRWVKGEKQASLARAKP